MRFNYQARTKEGLVQAGVIEASSKKEATSLLQKEGIYVTGLEEVGAKPFYSRQIEIFSSANKKDVMMFCRQLSMMLKSGVGLVESLKSLALQINKANFRKQILKVATDVEGGVYFSEALAKFPKVFSVFFINIVKSGEATGNLSEILRYLAEHLERKYALTGKIKSGMTYPAFILLVFLAMGVFAIFIILPSFKETLEDLGVELPVLTQMVLGLGTFMTTWWWAILLGLTLLVFSGWKYSKSEEGKSITSRLSLKIPLVGSVVKKVQLAQFTENLSTLILAGLPITQALEIVSGAISNKVYKAIIIKAQEGVRRGETMSSVFEKDSKHIPALVIQMMRVGERTGNLDEALLSVANFYQEEVNRRIDGLVDIIEPILIVILGGLISLLMVAIIVPMYEGMGDFGF